MNDVAERAQGLLCAAIAAGSTASDDPQKDIITAAKEAEAYADVIEIRLDSIANPAIDTFVRDIRTPLLFTNRPTWEGGSYNGDEGARVSVLLEAIQARAAYVDIEMKTAPQLRQQVVEAAKGSDTRVIVSWHNFKTTPSSSDLENVFMEQYESGVHIGKIVTMAHAAVDVLRVFDLLYLAAEKKFPLIAFCMGEAGVISRVATVELGGYMTYAAADSGMATAPGQMKISVLHDILQAIKKAK
jgi:3-dehydroquinate dehydratase-1/3-dehydroquinate dehydratase/shikimate dehydrogenase